jgi:WD40 repeat protein
LADHGSPITALASTSEGGAVAGTADGSLWLTIHSGESTLVGRHDQTVNAVAITDDDSAVVSAGDDFVVRVWNPAFGQLLREFTEHTATVDALALVETRVASAGDDRVILVWDLDTGEVLSRLVGHTDRVVALQWSADGERLVSSSEDGTVLVWDPDRGSTASPPLRNRFGVPSNAVAFEPGSSEVVLAAGPGVDRWRLDRASATAAACAVAGARDLSAAEASRHRIAGTGACAP